METVLDKPFSDDIKLEKGSKECQGKKDKLESWWEN